MPNENKETEVNKVDNLDNNLISSEEVEVAVRGDEEALLKQMERVKELTKQQELNNDSKKKLEEQIRKQKIEEERLREQEAEKKLIEEHKKKEEERKKQVVPPPPKPVSPPPSPKPAPQPTGPGVKQMDEIKKEPQEIVKKEVKTISNSEEGSPKHIGFKRFLAFIFLGGVIAMIWFIPQINDMITDYKKSKTPTPEITTGLSICTLEKTYENKDVKTTMKFRFVNRKINKLEYTIETKNAEEKLKTSDEYNECLLLKKEAGSLTGIIVSCSMNGNVITTKQILDYETIDSAQLSNSYLEAGGVYPEFKSGEDIGKIEENLLKTGYKCERTEM